MRKKTIGLSLFIVLVVAGIWTTWALFNDSQTKKGTITTGVIKISVIEKDKNGNPFEKSQEKIVPGDRIDRVVSVKNEGNKKAWVRLKLNKGVVETEVGKVDLSMVEIKVEKGWSEGGDGYYYYDTVLAPGAETSPAFKEVGLNIKANNEFSNKTITVDVQGDAVQADHNGVTISDADGWPATE